MGGGGRVDQGHPSSWSNFIHFTQFSGQNVNARLRSLAPPPGNPGSATVAPHKTKGYSIYIYDLPSTCSSNWHDKMTLPEAGLGRGGQVNR